MRAARTEDDVTTRARERGVPEHLIEGLALYVAHGLPPGYFLQAVLSNDLMEAMNRADLSSRDGLFALCLFIYNDLPAPCHGSRAKVAAWLEGPR